MSPLGIVLQCRILTQSIQTHDVTLVGLLIPNSTTGMAMESTIGLT